MLLNLGADVIVVRIVDGGGGGGAADGNPFFVGCTQFSNIKHKQLIIKYVRRGHCFSDDP